MAPPIRHLMTLLDDTGVAQHATYAVVAREHGYCLDDNARALLLAVSLQQAGWHPAEAALLFARAAAFVQHAWNGPARRFRNFMAFDRRWLDEAGSEDSHGRAVWVLGIVARDGADADAREWAAELVGQAASMLPGFTSPRALAFGLLGVGACIEAGLEPGLRDLGALLAERLCQHRRDCWRADWPWFEDGLSYDNARLPQALLVAGAALKNPDLQAIGLEALDWLCTVQTSRRGCFSPVGSDGFWRRGSHRARFDQQPLEASGTVAAALCAWRLTGAESWLQEARRAWRWFQGDNDLGRPLVVRPTGGCRDGLHPDRVNANQGAESTLAWLQADADLAAAEGATAPIVRVAAIPAP